MKRHDYAYPFRIDAASRKGALAGSYEAHVEQMILQVLLTSPGERADLPEFGCGIRRLLFAPNSEPLAAAAQILVRQSLRRWMEDKIDVINVEVLDHEEAADQGQLLFRIDYVIKQTLASKSVEVLVS